jgi:uncharacterized protein (TIGR00297 family)
MLARTHHFHARGRLSMLARASAAIIALAISLGAWRIGSLTKGGAAAATVVGAVALIAGWSWGVLLVAYFISSSALSRFGENDKQKLNSGIVEKGGARDSMQVLANGGVFAVAALVATVDPTNPARWQALGAGVLAVSASDTWATEIGTLVGGVPRSIVHWHPIPRGMSGGVTVAGTLAAIAGAAFVAVVAVASTWPTTVGGAALVGGFVGSTLDSVLGATLQTRRWCSTCRAATERAIHDCGSVTSRVGGIPGFGNDVVNFVTGLAGGLLALFLTR